MEVVQKMYDDMTGENLDELTEEFGNGKIKLQKMKIITNDPK